MIYGRLFLEFFKIGLFAVGGGMATLPFLRHLSQRSGWFPLSLIPDMVAISESTPGPIGINMATYVGYLVAGVAGGVAASVGVALPSLLLVSLISRSLVRFGQSPLVEQAFSGLRPAVTGLIAAAGLSVMQESFFHVPAFLANYDLRLLFDWKRLAYFIAIYFAIVRWKKHPLLYIALSALIGIIFCL